MSAHDAFLQVIQQTPDDDAPRLVYADWLEERGDPRGEFIRLQCRRLQLAEGDPLRPLLLRREPKYQQEWLVPRQALILG